MQSLKRLIKTPMVILLLIFLSNFAIVLYTASTESVSQNSTQKMAPPQEPILKPNTVYNADLHWVETNITLDAKGTGTVSMVLNCTPEEDHVGFYIRTIVEVNTLNLAKCYAVTPNETLDLNITATGKYDVSYYVYLKNATKAQVGVPILYYFSYNADFFQRNQIFHYEVDADLVAINLERPDWDDTLEYEHLRIQLPVEVTSSSIASTFLDEIGFDLDPQMEANYNLSYVGQMSTDNRYWLTVIASKEDLPERAAFEATFYLSIDYFSLPRVLNWFVITFSILFTLIALSLFIVVIITGKRTEEENQAFKEKLYGALKQEKE